MSGNVDRTLEGAQIAQERGARLSVLTNGQGGRLGALGGALYSLDIPDIAPFLCGTSSYTATLATLQLGFCRLDARSRFAEALGTLLPALPGFIEEADRFARSIAERAGGACPGARFLGVGSSVATADYGAAKFVEVTKIPAWSDDIEEFAHRQYWGMQTSEIVVLLPLDEGSARYADATADALSDLGVLTIALEPEGAGVPSAAARLALPGDGRTAGITQAIALQLLAYHLGFASGTDPEPARAPEERSGAVLRKPQADPPIPARHRTVTPNSTTEDIPCFRPSRATPIARSPSVRSSSGRTASASPSMSRWGSRNMCSAKA